MADSEDAPRVQFMVRLPPELIEEIDKKWAEVRLSGARVEKQVLVEILLRRGLDSMTPKKIAAAANL